jgi:hypothetical protein
MPPTVNLADIFRLPATGGRLAYSPNAPERNNESFSAEEDVGQLKSVLVTLAENFELRIPSAVEATRFLSIMDLNRWVLAPALTTDGSSVTLWFRLEDVDTVEVALVRDGVGNRVQ